ncbi:beta-ketoacyl synthase N-terminal-like domain-containing protein [Jidongwangia harbinensis]|uniref:beta-ketoacyl synthase N-terminal-like domain-containing protein n=1 Tax=Jidongwangia harbinensis TaxID=2878561 RepID=UPI001CD94ED9|nr:beta-ketoacyl synthase N-terminal-like domain-containing protein [Jidongwangia harbinensis]MCA2215093.1 beta-ketoacyl synthase [Jidongwangia harbinensis]
MNANEDGIVLSAWSAVSPFGLGAAEFDGGLASGASAVRAVPDGVDSGPFPQAGLVPSFDPAAVLGRKGTRAMDRVTALTVATAGMVLAADGEPDPDQTAAMGLVLGTSAGSYQSIMDFTASSMTGERPYLVDPARFPNTVMNRAAGQSAIWYGIKGPNATVSGGRLAGLLALNYAVRLCRRGRATTVLCGAVEELTAQRCWIDWHAGGRPDPVTAVPPGEGCAMFLVEPAGVAARHGRVPLLELAGIGFGAVPAGGDPAAALTDCIARTLDRNGIAVPDIALLAPGCPPGSAAATERVAVRAALGRADLPEARTGTVLGDTSAASAAFQVAGVLVAAGRTDLPAGSLALVTSIDPGGTVGCAVLRVPAPAPALHH